MIRIKRHLGKRFLLSLAGGLALVVVVGGGVYYILQPRPADAAIVGNDPSILNFPNTPVLGTNYTDEAGYSVQDVKLTKTSSGTYKIVNNYDDNANKWAEAEYLEIAKLTAHHMKSIQAGIYVTDDALNNNLKLSFLPTESNTGCKIYDPDSYVNNSGHTVERHSITDTNWSAINVNNLVTIYISGDDGKSWTTIHSFNAGSQSTWSSGDNLCGVLGPKKAGITFEINKKYNSMFQTDLQTGLKKVQIKISYSDDGNGDGIEGDGVYSTKNAVGYVRFKMRLSNSCASDTCREYIAPIRAINTTETSGTLDLNRNYSQVGSKVGAPDSNKSAPPQYLLRKYFEFGLPCTDTAAATKLINIYDVNDADWVLNADGSGSLIEGPPDRLVGVVLQRYGANGWENVAPSDSYTFKDYTDTKSYNGTFISTTTSDKKKMSATNPYLYSMFNNDASATSVIIPRSGNLVTTQITLTMQPSTRYRIMITPDGVGDFMAVGLPTDSIFGMISCNSAVSPKVAASASSVVDGQRVGFTFSTIKDAVQYFSSVSHYDYKTRVWYESSDTTPIDSSTYNSAEDLEVASCSYSGSDEQHPANTENHEINKCPAGYDPDNLLTGIKINAAAVYAATGHYPVAICAELTLTTLPGTEIESGAANPARKCIIIGKYPSVHITGGDVRVGDSIFANFVNDNADISTRSFTIDNLMYGSWGEYGLFAPSNGSIVSSSAGMLSGIAGTDPVVASDYNKSRLTFANTATPYGHWASAELLSMPNAIMGAATANSSLPAAQINLGANVTAGSGEIRAWNLTAGGGTVNVQGELPNGSGSVILFYNGTININGNITLGSSTINRLGAGSQVVIIARNITVDPSVSNVDAWLIASPATSLSADGRISTCGAIQSGAYYTGLKLGSECDKTPLRINGPVIARELQLRRTFGATTDTAASAAEVINLRPDAYIWGAGASGSLDIETTFTTELPPRF